MLYLLVERNRAWLEANDLGWLRVFTFAEFQAVCAFIVAFAGCLTLGGPVIRFLRARKIGDSARFDQATLDELMKNKRGTPTMGGVMIIAAILFASLLLADISNFYVQMGLICLVWLGAVGAIDDWLKLKTQRAQIDALASGQPPPKNTRQGLYTAEKLIAQVGLAVLLGYFIYRHGAEIEAVSRLYVPVLRSISLELGIGAFLLIAVLVLVGSSNAVNLTDGVDGLAAGCTAIAAGCLVVFSIIIGSARNSDALLFPHIPSADQMAVLAAALMGASLGFLWFNCHPAAVFMGDTGSLAMGGLIGYIAIVIRQELLLVLIGGIFVIEALSVIMQVGFFKYSRWRTGTGRRIFRRSPIHHHFQELGWPESKVVVRFWLVAAVLGAVALATIKLR